MLGEEGTLTSDSKPLAYPDPSATSRTSRFSSTARSPLSDSNPSVPCRLWFFFQGLPGYAWHLPKSGGTVNIGIGGKALSIRKKGHAFLVGDAAGLATADMGEGIANAVRSGILAAQAITEGSLIPTQAEPPFTFMSRLLGSPTRETNSGKLRQWSEPWPFSRILHRLYSR